MLRNICFTIVFLLTLSCDNNDSYVLEQRGDEKYNAADPPYRLFEFVLSRGALQRDDYVVIGPLEFIGYNSPGEGVSQHHSTCCEHLHTASEEKTQHYICYPQFVKMNNFPGDSLLMLLNYTLVTENDTVYEVIDGTLYIPVDNNTTTTKLNKDVLQGVALKDI